MNKIFSRLFMQWVFGVSFLLSGSFVYAHSGNTDEYDCHNDNINGGYHCHNNDYIEPSYTEGTDTEYELGYEDGSYSYTYPEFQRRLNSEAYNQGFEQGLIDAPAMIKEWQRQQDAEEELANEPEEYIESEGTYNGDPYAIYDPEYYDTEGIYDEEKEREKDSILENIFLVLFISIFTTLLLYLPLSYICFGIFHVIGVLIVGLEKYEKFEKWFFEKPFFITLFLVTIIFYSYVIFSVSLE